jgi:malonate transporter
MTLGSAATASALILTGVVVSAQRFRFNKDVFWTTVTILLLQPIFALSMTLLFHMTRVHVRDITIISSIPGGFFGLVSGKALARRLRRPVPGRLPTTVLDGLRWRYGCW